MLAAARAVARRGLRPLSRALLKALCRLERAVSPGDANPERSRPSSRVAARGPSTPAPTVVPLAVAGSIVSTREEKKAVTRDRRRILLLNPPRFQGIPVTRFYRSEYLFVDEHAIPATDLAYFAAAALGHAELQIVEANAEDLTPGEVFERIAAFRPDVIVCKGLVNVLEHDLAVPLAYKTRHPHVQVILSSRSTIGAEQEVFEEFPTLDGIARGEVDAFARDLADGQRLDAVAGMSVPGRSAGQIRIVEDLDAHPLPAFELMPRVWYRGAMSGHRTGFSSAYYGSPSGYYLVASRGCQYSCTYCMTGGIHGRPFRFRKRSPENVIEECRRLLRFGVRDVYFFDEIFTMPGHAEPICELLFSAGLPLSFICEGKPNLVEAPMLAAMKRAGCRAVYYGVESGDDGILRSIEKGHTAEDARRAMALTREAGLISGAYAMLGFPDETPRTVLRTLELLLEAEPDLIRYNFLMPYPVTVMHAEMVAAGLLDFDRKGIDRRINPGFTRKLTQRSHRLSPLALKALDQLFRFAFAEELSRSPAGDGEGRLRSGGLA